jgi:hypothetical protein
MPKDEARKQHPELRLATCETDKHYVTQFDMIRRVASAALFRLLALSSSWLTVAANTNLRSFMRVVTSTIIYPL